eukprot:TRINITY_DN100697_c0_g1_i1.p1 TRINITY_DN100697_c0_g1~~TRINITY_DN100697_c0_g1_i1.p1  ORF type:complete len:747 (-),score=136.41 TRINITY_DN100697_c0_g1_i1:34-2274(-)
MGADEAPGRRRCSATQRCHGGIRQGGIGFWLSFLRCVAEGVVLASAGGGSLLSTGGLAEAPPRMLRKSSPDASFRKELPRHGEDVVGSTGSGSLISRSKGRKRSWKTQVGVGLQGGLAFSAVHDAAAHRSGGGHGVQQTGVVAEEDAELSPTAAEGSSFIQMKRHAFQAATPTPQGAGGGAKPELLRRSNGTDGMADVWEFQLPFSAKSSFRRTFSVDAPADLNKEAAATLPILVDLHGYGFDADSERAWTQWASFQKEAGEKFILLTPDGSGDATASGSDFQGWNALGWSRRSKPVGQQGGNSGGYLLNGSRSDCLDWAVDVDSGFGYCCYQSQLELDPASCKAAPGGAPNQSEAAALVQRVNTTSLADGSGGINNTADHNVLTQASLETNRIWRYKGSTASYMRSRTASGTVSRCQLWSSTCTTSSAQNDAAFLAEALRLVLKHYRGDAERIYLFGQSMGGMAALDFARLDGAGLPEDVRPAAVIVASAGAARGHAAKLDGRVPALVMHGIRDNVVPSTPWSGMAPYGYAAVWSSMFQSALSNASLVREARAALAAARDGSGRNSLLQEKRSNKRVRRRWTSLPWRHVDDREAAAALLQADLRSGGRFLSRYLAASTAEDESLGCSDEQGRTSCVVSGDGFLYDPLHQTLRGVAGKEVQFDELRFSSAFPAGAGRSKASGLECADLPGTEALVRFCPFDGVHCLPWQDDFCEWRGGSKGALSFHQFVWGGFLQKGRLKRRSLST